MDILAAMRPPKHWATKRVLSAAGGAAIVKAAKKRWAKVRAQDKKIPG